ncbi:MAG TPA: 4'-phosphopantetheinyl transferase superfamily protein [Acidobacteriota bacterium]|nr:4'-phosphopantetheinyl transferase superfamily protein [Acidobacteriota bacterium]
MNTILYWLTQNLSDVPEDSEWLAEAERAVEAGLRFAKRRDDWRLGRWTAKQAVCAYLGKSGSCFPYLEIRSAADGAPEVFYENDPAGFSISISHCRRTGLCVASGQDMLVGCDVEIIEARENGFILDYFTAGEIEAYEQVPPEKKILASNLVWSAKESVLKILRDGLRRDTRSVEIRVDVSVEQQQWNGWSGRCRESSRTFWGWWKASEGLVYTMASGLPTSVPEQLIRVKGMR